MARQFCIQALAVLGLLTACVSSPDAPAHDRVRLTLPEDATRVVVLGSAEPNTSPAARDPVGRRRRPAGLALWSRSPDRLTLVDTPLGTLAAVRAIHFPQGFRAGRTLPAEAVLLTEAGPAQVRGLSEIADLVPADVTLEVFVPPGAAAPLRAAPRLAAARLSFRTPAHGESIPLGPAARATVFHVPLPDGGVALGYGIEGARRRFLYLPRLGPLESLTPALLDLVSPTDVALLDGRRFGPDDQPVGGGGAAGPSIGTLLQILEGVPADTHTIQFTNLTPGNPLLDLSSREARSLELSQRALALDGSEWWL